MKLCDIKNKRIAVGLFGISYRQSYNHWMSWTTNIDWRRSNYSQTVLRTLKESPNEVDHFMSTYHSDKESEILEHFNPKGYKLNEFECDLKEKSWVKKRHERFLETMELFPEVYDYYLMTRFDMHFSEECLLRCDMKEDSVNVTSKHGVGKDMELICDCFYIFGKDQLEPFRSFLRRLPPPDNLDICYYHKLHRYENAPKFSFLLEGAYYSHNCPLWRVLR